MTQNNNPITGKILLRGLLETSTPLHIGSGRGERSEMDIIRDHSGTPFIPASGLIGVLRHACPAQDGNNRFWGFMDEKDGRQSALTCDDLRPLALPDVTVRDGVRIDSDTGIATPQGKYDYELLEPGIRFQLNMEISLRQEDQETKRYVCTVIELLCGGQLRLGAKTGNGLGAVRLRKEEMRLLIFDFKKKEDIFSWLDRDFDNRPSAKVEELGQGFPVNDRTCRITAEMQLKSALIIRSPGVVPEMPDSTQLQSGDDWVVPGSSIRGALRSRAERIVKTLGFDQSVINNLFGRVEGNGEKIRQKGRLRVGEIRLPKKDFPSELQHRIRIDRFTGGVVNGGLFDSMPVFAREDGPNLAFSLEVSDYEGHDLGLLLLLLKDLWTGDLAIGGEKSIGRGVFQGQRAEISCAEGTIVIEGEMSSVSEEDRSVLQKYVDALLKVRKNDA